MNLGSRIKNKVDRVGIDLLFYLNLQKIIFSSKKGGVILCYHGVDLHEDKRFNMRFYSEKSLEQHFYYLKKYTNVISVNDYFEGKWSSDKLNVALTFDDGYKNNFVYLKPLLEKYQLPASIYITGLNQTTYPYLWADFADLVLFYTTRKEFEVSKFNFKRDSNGNFKDESGLLLKDRIKIEGNWKFKEAFFKTFENEFFELQNREELLDYWKLMRDDEILEASRSPLITIGSHSYYHNNLSQIPLNEAKMELQLSKNYLENLIQKEVNEIAYPDGSYSEDLCDWAYQSLGFTKQLALSFNHKSDEQKSYIRSRTGMYPVFSNANQLAEIQPLIKQVQ